LFPFFLLFTLFGTDFFGYVAPWWCFFDGACYLIYRILDEMDGKQARRTGNSSPLGLLFDHGCDAFTAALFCMMFIKTI
jgi:phosphatidylglycerophosphate synthase